MANCCADLRRQFFGTKQELGRLADGSCRLRQCPGGHLFAGESRWGAKSPSPVPAPSDLGCEAPGLQASIVTSKTFVGNLEEDSARVCSTPDSFGFCYPSVIGKRRHLDELSRVQIPGMSATQLELLGISGFQHEELAHGAPCRLSFHTPTLATPSRQQGANNTKVARFISP